MKTYRKTKNQDIVKEITTTEKEISISTLEKHITILTTDLKTKPNFLEYPKDASDQMKEAVDLWNMEQDSVFGQDEMQSELSAKKELLAKCELAE